MKINNVNPVIYNFKNFIERAFPAFSNAVNRINEDIAIEELKNDWLQANWEILVEAVLCKSGEFLEVYGDGADCNGSSSRVCFSDALPTHKIICRTKDKECFEAVDKLSGEIVETHNTLFHSFTFFDGENYFLNKTLNAVVFEKGDRIYVFNIDEINFFIIQINVTSEQTG